MKIKRYKLLIIFLLLFIACIFAHLLWQKLVDIMIWVFNIPNLNFWAGGFAFLLSLFIKFQEKEISFKNHIKFDDFKKILEELLSYVTGGSITLICSISLAKGLFFQWRGTKTYFENFEQWELIFISVITLYLLFISIQEVLKDLAKLVPSDKEFTPTPVDKNQDN